MKRVYIAYGGALLSVMVLWTFSLSIYSRAFNVRMQLAATQLQATADKANTASLKAALDVLDATQTAVNNYIIPLWAAVLFMNIALLSGALLMCRASSSPADPASPNDKDVSNDKKRKTVSLSDNP